MGTGEETSPTKLSKPTSSTQETPPTTAFPDWSSSMQAYYGAGATPPFFTSTVASPGAHAYLWAGQHPLLPPHGTPVPYPALYPPGGVYPHPTIAMTPSTLPASAESGGKTPEVKDRTSSKKFKGISGNGVTAVENGRARSGSGNDDASQSAETGCNGSSDADDDNNNENYPTKKGSLDLVLADGASEHRNSTANFQASVPGNPAVSMPGTNLNIGMDMWNASSAGPGAIQPSSVSSVAPPPMMGRQGMMNDQWIQDERELKRQKRKQSNRESARRSRLRKQAECEDLQRRVEILSNENRELRDELQRLSEECEKLTSDNNSIKEELTRLCGPDTMSKLENNTSKPQGGEGER